MHTAQDLGHLPRSGGDEVFKGGHQAGGRRKRGESKSLKQIKVWSPHGVIINLYFMQSIGLAAIRPTSQHKISTPKFGKAENTKNQKNNRQIFRGTAFNYVSVQNIKLTPNFKTNASQ